MANTPNSTGFSVAKAGARLGQGLRGIYRKAESKVLWLPASDGTVQTGIPGNPVNLSATIDCPSARIRVAFGVGGKNNNQGRSGFDDLNAFGKGSSWNVVPYAKIPDSYSSPEASADKSPYIAGRPLFWQDYGLGTGLDGDRPLFGPPGFEIVDGDSGQGNTPQQSSGSLPPYGLNAVPKLSVEQGLYGRLIPDAYEAISCIERYEIYVRMQPPGDTFNGNLPLQVWCVWEIVDPRDQEDTEALLAECGISAPSPKVGG